MYSSVFKKLSLSFLFVVVASTSFAFKTNTTVEDVERYDSLLSVWYSNNIAQSYDVFATDFIDIDLDSTSDYKTEIPDSVYQSRLNMMATEIQLPYNSIVRRYIEVYTSNRGLQMARLMGLARYYMPIFEKELDLNGIPDELKIIPIIESGLNPTAKSWVGAGGLWQFMLTVGKSYGLEVDSFVDERFDPVKSTKVACKFLKQLYSIYGDWTLVIAAYNCGPGNVNKAIKRAGKADSYWDIYYYLPRETRNHIPAFIGATYAYTFHKAHGIEPIMPPHPIVTDTIMVNKMTHFKQISSTLNISDEVIRALNPQYKLDIIPAKTKEYPLVLPFDDVSAFAAKESEIYGKDTIYLAKYMNISSGTQKAIDSVITYKVKRGDNLGAIAIKHGTTSSNLMRINGIRDARKLRIGQVIRVR